MQWEQRRAMNRLNASRLRGMIEHAQGKEASRSYREGGRGGMPDRSSMVTETRAEHTAGGSVEQGRERLEHDWKLSVTELRCDHANGEGRRCLDYSLPSSRSNSPETIRFGSWTTPTPRTGFGSLPEASRTLPGRSGTWRSRSFAWRFPAFAGPSPTTAT